MKTLLSSPESIEESTLGEICELFFPDILSVHDLLKIIEVGGQSDTDSMFFLEHSIENIVHEIPLAEEAAILFDGFYDLLKMKPFVNKKRCQISKSRIWLLPIAIQLANRFIKKHHTLSLNSKTFDLFLVFHVVKRYGSLDQYKHKNILNVVKEDSGFKYQLFWYAIETEGLQNSNKGKEFTYYRYSSKIPDYCIPCIDDIDRLFADLKQKNSIANKSIIIAIIFDLYIQEGRPRKLRERMKREVAGESELENKLNQLLRPKPLTEEQKKIKRKIRYYKKQAEDYERNKKVNRRKWHILLRENPEILKINISKIKENHISDNIVYLYDRIREIQESSKKGYSDWRSLIDEFGIDVAKTFRNECIFYWRNFDPYVSSDYFYNIKIGLCGLAMESADDSEWVDKLTRDEAEKAARYIPFEINGLPSWMEDLHNRFPEIVDAIIINELKHELIESTEENAFIRTISTLRYNESKFRHYYRDKILEILCQNEPRSTLVLEYALPIILEGSSDDMIRKKIAELAIDRFDSAVVRKVKFIWLFVLFYTDADVGLNKLKKWVKSFSSVKNKKELMVDFCSGFIDYGNPKYASSVYDCERIEIINELLPFIYKYIRVEEDVWHKGVYTPDKRDIAASTRSHLLSILINTPGKPSYDALINLSQSASDISSKDRLYRFAKERAALDAECQGRPEYPQKPAV